MERNLSELRPGEKGEVVGFDLNGAVRRRLMDMGLVRGSELKVEKIAPLGDPIEIRVRGYNLSIRKKDASGVKVV